MLVLDPRLVKIGIQINGILKEYQDLNITADGEKYANANQDECEVKISNIDEVTRDFILTQASPFNKNRTNKLLIVSAGRASYGMSTIFKGDITHAAVSQPPDITLTLKAMTGNFQKGKVIGRKQPAKTRLKNISGQVAKDLGVSLNYQATDKDIASYSFSGAALKQIDKLGDVGGVNAFLDGDTLTVKDMNVPLTGVIRVLNKDTGMIGKPEWTEQGIKVKFFIDNQTKIGSGVQVQSKTDPAFNGTYVIYKLSFSIATRDTPFYYVAECSRIKT